MYRVGHSMINETIPFTDSAGNTQEIPLFSAFLNPAMFDGKDPLTHGVGGAAAIIAGEVSVAHQRIDTQVVEVIRSKLLGIPLDLYAANIERGRETRHRDAQRVPSATSATTAAWLHRPAKPRTMPRPCPRRSRASRPTRLGQSSGSTCAATPAEQADSSPCSRPTYGEDDIHVNDVDLFVGGLAEAPVGASQMGSTFTWIFQEQLDRLQEGDRFYYFNQLKDAPLLLADIGSQHFSDIVMRNTGLDHLHYAIFKVSERIDLGPHERSLDLSAHPATADKVLTIVGNALPNVITGTPATTRSMARTGTTRLNGGLGLDALHGGAGDDLLKPETAHAAYSPMATTATTPARQRGRRQPDRRRGRRLSCIGGSGKDFLSGGDGDDWLMRRSPIPT